MKNYTFQDRLVLRTPFKPFRASVDLTVIENIVSDPGTREALFLSSPSVVNQIDDLIAGKLSAENSEKLKFAIQKYLLRMHSRSTPFGLMAGCTVLNWGENTEITLKNKSDFNRHTRLDMHYWGELLQHVTQIPSIQKHLRYYPNSSLYSLGDKIRYVEYEYQNKSRKYRITAVDHSEYLDMILKKAAAGAYLEELIETLISNAIEREDASAFIMEVINAQLLVSELEPSVTGAEYMEQLLPVLKKTAKKEKNEEINTIITILEAIDAMLTELDKNRLNAVKQYYNIMENLKQLNIPVEPDKLFQVDMYKSLQHGKLSRNLQKDLYKTLSYLERIPKTLVQTNLTNFKRRFYDRFEERAIPLLEALDNETGIGYLESQVTSSDNSPFIRDIHFPGQQSTPSYQWSDWDIFLHRQVENCLKDRKYILELKDEMLKILGDNTKEDQKKLPDTMAVMFSHVEQANGADKLLIYPVGGSGAANLLGRFACNNEEINGIVQSITRSEQDMNPNAVLAEIVHLPESRVGNVLHRPLVRSYEIPYLAKSAIEKDKQIPLDDLLVSIKNDRIVLRSKMLNKEIIPRLTSAHNYSRNAQPVYQFLCELQNQGWHEGIYFSWGNVESMYAFLPRVVYKNIILAPATWNLKKEDYESLITSENNKLLTAVQKFRDSHNMPQRVAIADSDNHLIIDLGDLPAVKLMISIIKKRPFVKLIEFLFDPETAIVRDVDGNAYTNQFIATLVKNTSGAGNHISIPSESLVTRRSFSLGSEWLYYKIYCGYKTADRVLTEVIKPLTEDALEKKLISQWFFIRYGDPGNHIRVRFKLTDTHHLNTLIGMFNEKISLFRDWGLVSKIQTDTYKRELERYGSKSIILAEELFFYDSVGTVNMLDMIEGDAGEEIRWQYGIRAIDELLDAFNYTLVERRDLLESLKIGFGAEFNMNRELKSQLDKKFRRQREKIEAVLDRTKDDTSEFQVLLVLLEDQKTWIRPIAGKLLEMAKNNTLEVPVGDLLSSYIHMLMNRLFRSRQRAHEMVTYDFLYRAYRSLVARAKNNAAK